MRVTHLGHSCLLVESSGVRVLVDPGAFSHGFEELTDLSAVLVTHQHLDHLDVERLPQLLEANDGANVVVEPETAAELSRAGIDARPLHPGEDLALAGLTVSAVGGTHALIHTDIPRVGNVGFVLAEESGPRLFHPGDAIDTAPDGVDVLALPLAAPWSALKETVDFLRAVSPRTWFPIHDALLSDVGRGVFLRVGGSLAPDGAEQVDLAGAGPREF